MILFYRRHKDDLNSLWHFHTECPDWPDVSFVQLRVLQPGEHDRVCLVCAKLEAAMFPTKNA
jgi:hypothetical protein